MMMMMMIIMMMAIYDDDGHALAVILNTGIDGNRPEYCDGISHSLSPPMTSVE